MNQHSCPHCGQKFSIKVKKAPNRPVFRYGQPHTVQYFGAQPGFQPVSGYPVSGYQPASVYPPASGYPTPGYQQTSGPTVAVAQPSAADEVHLPP